MSFKRTLAATPFPTGPTCFAVLILAVAPVAVSAPAPAAAVEPASPMAHVAALAAIADANGGNRTAGAPGFDRSAEYVAERLRAGGYIVRAEEFTFPYFQENSPPALEVVAPEPARRAARKDAIRTMANSGSGEVTARLHSVDLHLQEAGLPAASTSGCEADDFSGFPRGAVALLRRGTCTFQVKVDNAVAAGAAAALIMNEGRGGLTEVFPGQLRNPAPIPAVAIPYELGRLLAGSASSGNGATVRVAVYAEAGTRSARNVIGEAEGVVDRVVVVGAHLDSVPKGPGINDNASGVAAVLEAALRLAEAPGGPPPGIRFAFWGAEENGLIGSRHHVSQLAEEERRRVAIYINLDMVASTNFGRFIYGLLHPPDTIAGVARSAFLDFFRHRDLPVEVLSAERPGYGSDDRSFADHWIPTIGLHTGAGDAKSPGESAFFGGRAGEPYDRCYHQACDTAGNVDPAVLGEMTEALLYSLARLMIELD